MWIFLLEFAISKNDCRRFLTPRAATRGHQVLTKWCYYTFDKVIRGGSIGAGIAVTALGALSEPLALFMPLAMSAFAETDPVCLATVTSFGTRAPVTPITPAVATWDRNRSELITSLLRAVLTIFNMTICSSYYSTKKAASSEGQYLKSTNVSNGHSNKNWT